MEQPIVSVILCTYNGERFIAEQVDSILRQSYEPLELVICDDASTDGTTAVLERYRSHPRVTIQLNKTTLGISQNFATGIRLAKGDYIAFADQDDIWLETKIEQLLHHRGNYPLVYSNSLLVDEAGNSLHKTLKNYKKMYTGTDSRCYILYTCVWGHGMLVTRELAERSLPIPASVHHDVWIAFLAFNYGGIYYHDAALTLYRQHQSSFTNTIPQKTKSRKRAERWKAYQQQLLWIELMRDNERPMYKPFYTELATFYRRKATPSYVWGLVFFMIKYRKALFRLSHKGILSQLVEIFKQGRGERP